MPLVVGPKLVLTVYVDHCLGTGDHDADEWIPRLEFTAPTVAWSSQVPAGHVVRAVDWASLYVMPRAVELADGRPERVLLDLVPMVSAETGRVS
jgi:hypothetical protein